MALAIRISDRADGTGINIDITGSAGETFTGQYLDSAQAASGAYTDGGTIVGDGQIVLPAPSQVNVQRTFYVRVKIAVGINPPTYTVPGLVTPTQGYDSLAWRLILTAKHKAIRLNLPKILGNVYHCLDAQGFYASGVPQAALLIYPGDEETDTGDNKTALYTQPIVLAVTQTMDRDWVTDLPWWLAVRERLIREFDRQPIDLDAAIDGLPEDTQGGRKWSVRYGPVIQNEPTKYHFKFQSVVLLAKAERDLKGV